MIYKNFNEIRKKMEKKLFKKLKNNNMQINIIQFLLNYSNNSEKFYKK